MASFTHLGLFEGIGGFSLAARCMGWDTVAWCEWDENCQRVLKYHLPNAIPHDDITKTDFTRYAGQIDILTGGFPCQPYSTAGKRLGKDDDRHLWPEMLRAIREVRPRWVVGENVRGLVSWNGGLVFDEVQADLEAEGYEVLPFILPACAVNAPHRRDRVWFVAFNPNSGTIKREGQDQKIYEPNEIENRIGICSAQNPIEIRRNSEQPESKPGEREQWQSGAGDNVRVSNVTNANESRRKGWQGKTRWEHSVNGNDWRFFPTQPPVCGGNDGISRRLDGITFPKWREFAIGSYGNAIVPQVAHQIFKAIEQWVITSKDGQQLK